MTIIPLPSNPYIFKSTKKIVTNLSPVRCDIKFVISDRQDVDLIELVGEDIFLSGRAMETYANAIHILVTEGSETSKSLYKGFVLTLSPDRLHIIEIQAHHIEENLTTFFK